MLSVKKSFRYSWKPDKIWHIKYQSVPSDRNIWDRLRNFSGALLTKKENCFIHFIIPIFWCSRYRGHASTFTTRGDLLNVLRWQTIFRSALNALDTPEFLLEYLHELHCREKEKNGEEKRVLKTRLIILYCSEKKRKCVG